MSDVTSYIRSHKYESFIKLARVCGREKFGAHNSNMKNLIDKEADEIQISWLKLSQLLSDVKKYMTSATKFAVKRKLDKADKDVLTSYIDRIKRAQSSDELLQVCDAGTEILRKYK